MNIASAAKRDSSKNNQNKPFKRNGKTIKNELIVSLLLLLFYFCLAQRRNFCLKPRCSLTFFFLFICTFLSPLYSCVICTAVHRTSPLVCLLLCSELVFWLLFGDGNGKIFFDVCCSTVWRRTDAWMQCEKR